MKTILAAVLLSLVAFANAADIVIPSVGGNAFNGDLTQETALAYTKSYTYDLANQSIGKISAEVIHGTATIASATFTDGRTSAGTVTVLSTSSLCGTIFTLDTSSFNFGGCPPYDSRTATKVAIGASVTAAAANLCKAITQTDTYTASIATCTTSAGVISLVSRYADGEAYGLTSSASSVTVNAAAMASGVLSKVNTSTDKIYMLAHSMTTGLPVLYSGAVAITPLTTGTTYYVIRIDANYIKLATTSAQAVLGDNINILSFAENATETTYTIAPLDFSGTAGWYFSESNDNVYFRTIPSISSGTIATSTATQASWIDFSDVNYRYLKLNVTGPTTGGIILNTWLYLKR